MAAGDGRDKEEGECRYEVGERGMEKGVLRGIREWRGDEREG